MPLVALRQLLDEAAAGGYGVGAFNVNNMEQIQAIMEAARETDSPVDRAGLARRALVLARQLPASPDACRGGALSRDPVAMHQDHGNSPGHVHLRHRQRLHERDDGRLADGRRQDAGRLRVQRRGHPRGRRVRPRPRRLRRRRARRRSAASRTASARATIAPDRPRPGRRVRRAPASTRWPSPSAPATAPTSSRASRRAKCSRWTASRRSTSGCPTRTS